MRYFTILLFLVACMGSSKASDCDRKMDQMVSTLAKRVRKDGLVFMGSGGGIRDGRVRVISASFDIGSGMTISEARKRLVNTVDVFIELIQNNPEFAECFSDQSSLDQYIEVSIFTSSHENAKEGYITGVSKRLNEIKYTRSDSDTVSPAEVVHQETYAEAVAIVKRT